VKALSRIFRGAVKRGGQVSVRLLIYIIIGIVAVAVLLPMVQVSTLGGAISHLEGQGYIVLAAGEYNTIMALLNSIDAKADAAVANAEAAVIAAQAAADKVDMFNSAEVYLFPAASSLTCVLTAGNTNIWSAWTEVVDSGANTLSDEFAADTGYVSDMLFFLPSDAADGYNVELAYGAAKTTLGRVGMWALADGDVAYVLPIKSRQVPAGETIYYRMQSTGANGATIQVRFRYFYG